MPIWAEQSSWCVLGLALLLVPLFGSVGAAQVLDIPAECGSAEELNQEIAALQQPKPQRVRPPVSMYREGAGYVLEVDLPLGRRRLRDDDCRSLFRAAVVIAALGEDAYFERPRAQPAAQPDEPGVEQGPEPEPAPEPARSPATAESLSKPPATRPAPRPPRRAPSADARELAPFVLGALSYGLVPKVDALLAAGLALRRGPVAGRAALGYLTPRSHHDGDEGVSVMGLSASATVELVLVEWLRPGLGADYHLLRGRGLGISRTRDDWAALASLHASLGVRLLRVRRFQVDLMVRGLYAPRSSHFRIRGRRDVYETERFAVQAGLALSYHLW